MKKRLSEVLARIAQAESKIAKDDLEVLQAESKRLMDEFEKDQPHRLIGLVAQRYKILGEMHRKAGKGGAVPGEFVAMMTRNIPQDWPPEPPPEPPEPPPVCPPIYFSPPYDYSGEWDEIEAEQEPHLDYKKIVARSYQQKGWLSLAAAVGDLSPDVWGNDVRFPAQQSWSLGDMNAASGHMGKVYQIPNSVSLPNRFTITAQVEASLPGYQEVHLIPGPVDRGLNGLVGVEGTMRLSVNNGVEQLGGMDTVFAEAYASAYGSASIPPREKFKISTTFDLRPGQNRVLYITVMAAVRALRAAGAGDTPEAQPSGWAGIDYAAEVREDYFVSTNPYPFGVYTWGQLIRIPQIKLEYSNCPPRIEPPIP